MQALKPFFRNPSSHNPSEPLEVQIIDWTLADEPIAERSVWQCVARGFGVTPTGESVCVLASGFQPFLYVQVPPGLSLSAFRTVLSNIGGNSIDVHSSCFENHIDIYGFRGAVPSKFGKVVCNKLKGLNESRQYFIDTHPDWQLFEADVDRATQFVHQLGFVSWIRIKPGDCTIIKANQYSTCQLTLRVATEDIVCFANDAVAPILMMSYDIETNSSTGDFPNAEIAEDEISMIASTYKRHGTSKDNFFAKTIFINGSCATLPDPFTSVVQCYDEQDMLLKWAISVQSCDPDIVVSYNGFGFDDNYVAKRAARYVIGEEVLACLSRLHQKPSQIVEAKFTSSARGSRVFNRLQMHGRFNFDLLVYIQAEFQLEFYKLDFVAEQFLGMHKNDVTPRQIFDAFQSHDPAKTATIAKYCIQDTMLPIRLIDAKEILVSLIEMSRATFVRIEDLHLRGQEFKVVSQILKFAHARNYILPSPGIRNAPPHKLSRLMNNVFAEPFDEDDEQKGAKRGPDGKPKSSKKKKNFQGATVLEPNVGAYFDPIAVYDFASLYPSIIRAHNMCFSTLVMEMDVMDRFPQHKYAQIDVPGENGAEGHTFWFCQDVPGVLPGLLAELAAKRKAVRAEMGKLDKVADKSKLMVLDKRQLAIKISSNSVYGFLGAYKLPCKPIGACVTATGREMILATKNYLETNFVGTEVIYGDTDSVFVKFCPSISMLPMPLYMARCGEISAEITKAIFKTPISLEFEKVYTTLLLFKKKK